MTDHIRSARLPGLSRRGLLLAGTAGTAGLVVGGTALPASAHGELYSAGAHVDPPDSYGLHNYGRAFDIREVWFKNSGTETRRFDLRYDVWRDKSTMTWWRKRYWGVLGSLHYRFRHVLSYLDNAQHHDHVHVDDAVYSLIGDSRFYCSSTTQTLFVQAACTWVWGEPTARDGSYGEDRRVSHNLLRRLSLSGYLHNSPSNWRNFCKYTYFHAIDIT